MMTSHRKLTPWQEREYLYYARQMQAEGIPIAIPDEWEQHARSLEITIAPPPDSDVFGGDGGALRYSVYVRLLSRTRCMVEHAAITVPWDNQILLENLDQKYPVGWFGYPPVAWKEALNARIQNGLKFARAGEVVEGFILASGVERFPQEYRTGLWAPFTLSLYDQYGCELAKDGYLYVERAEGLVRKCRVPRTELFGQDLSSSQNRESTSVANSDGRQQRLRAEEEGIEQQTSQGR